MKPSKQEHPSMYRFKVWCQAKKVPLLFFAKGPDQEIDMKIIKLLLYCYLLLLLNKNLYFSLKYTLFINDRQIM